MHCKLCIDVIRHMDPVKFKGPMFIDGLDGRSHKAHAQEKIFRNSGCKMPICVFHQEYMSAHHAGFLLPFLFTTPTFLSIESTLINPIKSIDDAFLLRS